jgi:hypothetical protein
MQLMESLYMLEPHYMHFLLSGDIYCPIKAHFVQKEPLSHASHSFKHLMHSCLEPKYAGKAHFRHSVLSFPVHVAQSG